ncbi:shikimate kinase [Burkholderia sp. D-99]|uniref:shikimate kinase n=1 Tax=Burkholderia sp. D-99 TaxID=2717316 RepID=UPI00141E9049|nr:shikimate kinase [Burkholderia sp. D-99]
MNSIPASASVHAHSDPSSTDSRTGDDPARIALIGMMGVGKTAVGRQLAAMLKFPYVDSDRVVEARTNWTVAELFAHDGEAAFRAMEAGVVDELTRWPRAVIATGGGAILDTHTRLVLTSRTRVVWLRAEPEELLRRMSDDSQRPLLRHGDRLQALLELSAQRAPLYRQCAHVQVDTDGKTVAEVVADILGHLSPSHLNRETGRDAVTHAGPS